MVTIIANSIAAIIVIVISILIIIIVVVLLLLLMVLSYGGDHVSSLFPDRYCGLNMQVPALAKTALFRVFKLRG